MSTLRERIEALAKEYEQSVEGWKHGTEYQRGARDWIASFVGRLRSALESETREARTLVDAAGVARLLDAIDTAEALTTKTNAEIGRLLLDHVWQHMDLNSAAELVMSEAISRLAPDLDGDAPPPANTENDR